MFDNIIERAQELAPSLSKTRRDLHRHPEPGWFEMRSASLIARRLADLGYEVLVGREVCLDQSRMGLPSEAELESHYAWAEKNGADADFLPATRGGFTGVIGILRCGEGPTVALRFDIDALGVAECEDSCHAPAAQGFISGVKGKAAHAGLSPQEGDNALLAAATAVLNLHAIPRYGATPTQLNVGKLTAGTGRNVVCDRALLELEVRGATTEANDYMENYALRICQSAAAMHGCAMEVKRMGGAAQLLGSKELTDTVIELCRDELGMKTIITPSLGGGSEDFAYMAQRVQSQGGQASYLGLLSVCPAVNHNDKFDFEESALVNGVKMFTGSVLRLLGKDR